MNRKERRRQQKVNEKAGASRPALNTVDAVDQTQILHQANLALSSGQLAQAKPLIDQILHATPDHPDGLNLKAALQMKTGDISGAVRILTKVSRLIPDFAQSHFNLGTALSADKKLRQSIRSFRRALEIDPAYSEAHYNLANAFRQLGSLTDAIRHYEEALQQSPNHTAAATNLASACLELGNPKQALDASQHALKLDPGNRDAFSFAAIAATETGDTGKAAHLLSPAQLIRPHQFDTCEGFNDLASFNTALVEHVVNHPTLTKNAHNKATRNGAQTENMALGETGPVSALQELIGIALDEYLAAISELDHPYPPLIPNLTTLDIWGTVLNAQGHQAAHMHRAAWVSGVYYAKLPDVMKQQDGSQDGWIEFCRPPDIFKCRTEHQLRVIEPREGLMVLFPSYIYHRTIPFVGDQQRVSIAFDLLA